jgi:hypothetical protein
MSKTVNMTMAQLNLIQAEMLLYLHTQFHMPSCNGLLLSATNEESNTNFAYSPCYFYILQKFS